MVSRMLYSLIWLVRKFVGLLKGMYGCLIFFFFAPGLSDLMDPDSDLGIFGLS